MFINEEFGYSKVQVERPLRLAGLDPNKIYSNSQINKLLKDGVERDPNAAPVITKVHAKGTEPDPLVGLFEIEFKGVAPRRRPSPPTLNSGAASRSRSVSPPEIRRHGIEAVHSPRGYAPHA